MGEEQVKTDFWRKGIMTVLLFAFLLLFFRVLNNSVSPILFSGDRMGDPVPIAEVADRFEASLASLNALSFGMFAVFGYFFFSENSRLHIASHLGWIFSGIFLASQVSLLVVNFRVGLRLAELTHRQSISTQGIIDGISLNAFLLYIAFSALIAVAFESIRNGEKS